MDTKTLKVVLEKNLGPRLIFAKEPGSLFYQLLFTEL